MINNNLENYVNDLNKWRKILSKDLWTLKNNSKEILYKLNDDIEDLASYASECDTEKRYIYLTIIAKEFYVWMDKNK